MKVWVYVLASEVEDRQEGGCGELDGQQKRTVRWGRLSVELRETERGVMMMMMVWLKQKPVDRLMDVEVER